ncbi:MAG: hypothetical protein C4295_01745 [Candidatus Fervidibacterota bacterium]
MVRLLGWLTGMLLLSAVAVSAQQPIGVALLGVADESSYGGAVFKAQVAEAVMQALNATCVFAVRDEREKVQVPATPETIARVGTELQAPAALQIIVKSVVVRKPKGDPQVTIRMEASLVVVKAPFLVFRALAEGKGDDPTEGRAVAKAVASTASEIAKQLSTLVRLRGQVLLPPAYAILPATHYKERNQLYPRTLRISLDMVSGLAVGAEVVILQQGKLMAKGRVVEVDLGSSLVALEEVLSGAQIRSGDEVCVVFLPQRPAKLPLPLAKEREYKRVEHDFAWALLLAGIGVAIWGK